MCFICHEPTDLTFRVVFGTPPIAAICHKQKFLLKFEKDRKRWHHWLYEAKKRYGLCVLDYIVTSNHTHLLVDDTGEQVISKSFQLIAGRTALEYNIHKKRKGAFWEDRYHATKSQVQVPKIKT